MPSSKINLNIIEKPIFQNPQFAFNNRPADVYKLLASEYNQLVLLIN